MEDSRGKDRNSSGGAAKPKANSSPNYLKPQNRSPKAITQQTREKLEREKSPKRPPKGLPISKSTGNLRRASVSSDCKDRTPTARYAASTRYRSYSKSPPKPLMPFNYVSGKKYQKNETPPGTDGKPVQSKPVPRRDSLEDRAGLRRTSVERVAAQERFRFQSREIIPKRTDQLVTSKVGKILQSPSGVEKMTVRPRDEKKEETPADEKKNEKNNEVPNKEKTTKDNGEIKLTEKTSVEKKKELPCELMKEERTSEKKKEEKIECKSAATKNEDKSAEKMRKKSNAASVMNEEILKPFEVLNLDDK